MENVDDEHSSKRRVAISFDANSYILDAKRRYTYTFLSYQIKITAFIESHRKHLIVSVLNRSYFHLFLTTLLFILPLALGIQSPTTSANYGDKNQAQKVSNIRHPSYQAICHTTLTRSSFARCEMREKKSQE